MTSVQERNVAVAQLWVDTYNHDVERMVDECYAPDCEVQHMSSGLVLRGREELRTLERAVLQAVPERRMWVRRCIPASDTVVMEIAATIGTGDVGSRTTNACVVLTFRDGLIVSDHTYVDATAMVPPAGAAP
jgi:ketosteroid isomerase-like protein